VNIFFPDGVRGAGVVRLEEKLKKPRQGRVCLKWGFRSDATVEAFASPFLLAFHFFLCYLVRVIHVPEKEKLLWQKKR
jgi:hypothetical protein